MPPDTPNAGPEEALYRPALAVAFAEADKAAGRGEVPIGAALVESATGKILAAAGNETIARSDPTAHAEILVIRAEAAARRAQRLPDCSLVVTLEPCAMCAAAISFARIQTVLFAAPDAKGGAVWHGPRFYGQPTCHWRPAVIGGVEAERSAALLKAFFRARR
ncbi:MAG: nucleoside deaminase [Pseudomonadota bacterium]